MTCGHTGSDRTCPPASPLTPKKQPPGHAFSRRGSFPDVPPPPPRKRPCILTCRGLAATAFHLGSFQGSFRVVDTNALGSGGTGWGLAVRCCRITSRPGRGQNRVSPSLNNVLFFFLLAILKVTVFEITRTNPCLL